MDGAHPAPAAGVRWHAHHQVRHAQRRPAVDDPDGHRPAGQAGGDVRPVLRDLRALWLWRRNNVRRARPGDRDRFSRRANEPPRPRDAASGDTVHRRPDRPDLHDHGAQPSRRLPRVLVHRLPGSDPVPSSSTHRHSGARRTTLRAVPLLHADVDLLAFVDRQGSGDAVRPRAQRVRRRSTARPATRQFGAAGRRARPGLHDPTPRRLRRAGRPRRCPRLPASGTSVDRAVVRAARAG